MATTNAHRPLAALSACALLLGLSACGRVADGEGDDGGARVTTLEETRQTLANIVRDHACRVNWECPYAADDLMLLARAYPDQATCRRELTVFHDLLVWNEAIASVAAGRRRFDADRANACITQLRARLQTRGCLPPPSGDTFRVEGIEACGEELEFTTGIVGEGGACIGGDCAEGLGCNRTGGECYGACAPIPPEPCGEQSCGGGLFCVRQGNDYSCLPSLAEGEACTVAVGPADPRFCARGMLCFFADAEQSVGVCRKHWSGARGERCNPPSYEWCADGLACIDGVCVDAPIANVKRAGEVCDDDNVCAGGLVCAHQQRVGLERVGTCDTPRAAGDPCMSSIECAAGLRCDEDALVCTPRSEVGAPCRDEGDCLTFTCIDDVCVRRADLPICEVPTHTP